MDNDYLKKTLTSLALVKINWDINKGIYLDYFLPFLSTLFAIKKYNYINEDQESIEKLIIDFKNEFGLDIPYHPMISILNQAKKKKIIKKEEHRYYITNEIYKYDFTPKVKEQVKKYDKVIDAFIKFSEKKHSRKINKKEAEEVLIYFLKQYDLDILFATYRNSALPDVAPSKQNLYIFSQFIQNLFNNDYSLFQAFLDIVIGHTLTNAIFYGNEMGYFINPKLRNLNLYLDTRLILRLAGIEGKEIKNIYTNLLKEFKEQGINLFVFSHTYDEIKGILQNSLHWIEKPNYNPLKASQVLRYFKSQGFKESDVQMFINSLDRQLEENNITKIEPPDYKTYSNYLIDENKLEESIKDIYSKYNTRFEYDAKSFTIQKDIRSISSIYMLRKGQKPVNIKQAKYIFVTGNSALAYAVRKFEKKNYGEGFFIPTTVTDTFVGTLIWLRNPNKVTEISEKKIIANIYSALQPSEELLKQYIAEIEKLREKGDITEEDFILLRDSQIARDLLSNKTLGDPQKFTPKTSIEILDEMKREAFEEYNKEKNEHKRTKEELAREREEREKLFKQYERKAKKWANIFQAILLIVFILSSIFSWFKIEGIFKWIVVIITLAFSVISFLGLTIGVLKRRIKNLILDKVFGIRNNEHGV